MAPARLTRTGIPVAFLGVLVIVLLLVPTERLSSSPSGVGHGAVLTPPGVSPSARPGSSGRTLGGIACKPGVRQVTWTVYSPECVPAYHGNNGGSSSPGVTRTAITLSYRQVASSVLQEVYTLFPKAIIGDNAEVLTTYSAYIKVFNRDFELYGRHVVLKTFEGQGNFMDELSGSGQAAAEADAVAEKSAGVFVDDSGADSSDIFAADLAHQHIVTMTMWPVQGAWFRDLGGYAYAPGPIFDQDAAAAAAFAADQLEGFPAVDGGDTWMKTTDRKLAFVYQATPYEQAYAREFLANLATRHEPQPELASYFFNFATLIQDAATIVAKMRADRVTTIFFESDPISPIFFMQAAASQGYFPEWVMLSNFNDAELNLDSLGTLPAQTEMAHAFALGIEDQPVTTSEAYKVFEVGCRLPPRTSCSDPLPAYALGASYATILMIFSGLQAAGPWLTPSNFARGLATLPGGPSSGMFGKWEFGPGTIDPNASFQVLKYDPYGQSPLNSSRVPGTPIQPINGGKGVYLACNGGQQYLYAHPVLPHHQPDCRSG